MCEILVGLGDVNVLDVDDSGTAVVVTIETRATVSGCQSCGAVATSKGRRAVSLVDCCQGLRTFVVTWLKRRWHCPRPRLLDRELDRGGPHDRLPSPRPHRSGGRWATEQVGRFGRNVNEVATALGCDWHTVNDAVTAYGGALVDDPERIGKVSALGLDEVLFVRRGTYRTAAFSTQPVAWAPEDTAPAVTGTPSWESTWAVFLKLRPRT